MLLLENKIPILLLKLRVKEKRCSRRSIELIRRARQDWNLHEEYMLCLKHLHQQRIWLGIKDHLICQRKCYQILKNKKKRQPHVKLLLEKLLKLQKKKLKEIVNWIQKPQLKNGIKRKNNWKSKRKMKEMTTKIKV